MNTELFSEVYNCYYQIVGQILKEAAKNPVTSSEMEKIAQDYGFEESALAIIPHLISGEWKLLTKKDDGYCSKIDSVPVLPLTYLQKSWLKALLKDVRLSLFFSDSQLIVLEGFLKDVHPLYDVSDFLYFDRYADGDDMDSIYYRKHFQMVLDGIKEKEVLLFSYLSGKGNMIQPSCLPCKMEYSQKDNKFRVYTLFRKRSGSWMPVILNMGRILRIQKTGFHIQKPVNIDKLLKQFLCREPVVIEISTERNALERTMLHFASYQKKTQKLGESGKYLCSIYYNKNAETELLIEVLSFGPVIRVLGPDSFLSQIRERVQKQAEISSLHNPE